MAIRTDKTQIVFFVIFGIPIYMVYFEWHFASDIIFAIPAT